MAFLKSFLQKLRENIDEKVKLVELIDNPDFDHLKGVASFTKEECPLHQEDIWQNPESFAHDMSAAPYHHDIKKVLKTSLKRKDIDRLINACDAGREGELIFRLIAQYTKAPQKVSRLWLQSMTPQAIRDGFGALCLVNSTSLLQR